VTNRLLILSIFAAMSTASIHAQDATKLKVNVPFSFHVGQTAMPAGIYTVQNGKVANGILTMQSDSGAGGVHIGTIPNSASRPPVSGKLVFHKYEGEYFLSEVWTPNSTTIATLRKTPKEAELVAKGKNPDQTILVARR